MSKVFINYFYCKTHSEIFTGKNALQHALFYITYGKICTNADQLYNRTFQLLKACSWREGLLYNKAIESIQNDGIHAKLYETKEHIIYSSQNNTNSALFEFAIIYKKKPKLFAFFLDTFNKAKKYQNWWKHNRNY